jgi:recombination protein RecA
MGAKTSAKSHPKRPPPRNAKRPVRSPVIKVDLLKEYDQTIRKDGVAESLALSDDACLSRVRGAVSTQSLALDRLLNGQGFPFGRVSELYGPPHIGKSTLLDHAFAEVQRMGGAAVLIDSETARDINYTKKIGVDPTRLRNLEFKRGELHIESILIKIYDTVEFFAARAPDYPVVIGWDALGGTATRDELGKRLEKESRMAQAAQVLRKACRQLPGKLGGTKVAVVIVNHEYEHIPKPGTPVFVGKKRETYGGDAVRHLASIRLQLFHLGWVKDVAGEVIGREVGAKLIKNRLGNPWGETRFALLSGIGIDNTWSVFTRLKEARLIVTEGSWSAINLDGTEYYFQGYRGLQEKIVEDESLFPRLVAVYKTLT